MKRHYHVTPVGPSSVSEYKDDGTHIHKLANPYGGEGYSELGKEMPHGNNHCHISATGPTGHALIADNPEWPTKLDDFKFTLGSILGLLSNKDVQEMLHKDGIPYVLQNNLYLAAKAMANEFYKEKENQDVK